MTTRFPKAATWHGPLGPVLVCRALTGQYMLYTIDEWELALPAEYEADDDGHVMRRGRYVDYDDPEWVVPEGVLENAID
jgi:hypothetical protein